MDSCLESIALPSSIDAEKAILGSIMLDNGAFLESSMRIFDSDFYYDSHRTIYAQMMKMFEQGLTVDIITLQESLSRAKQLEAIGGVKYLATLAEGLPRFLSLDLYLRIIKDKSLLRQVIAAGSAAVYQAADDGDAPLEVINTLESRISEIAGKSAKKGYSRVGEILAESFGSIATSTGRVEK